jgi:hypothetical protein
MRRNCSCEDQGSERTQQKSSVHADHEAGGALGCLSNRGTSGMTGTQ